MEPGKPARHDYEYIRRGYASAFVIHAPLEGVSAVHVGPKTPVSLKDVFPTIRRKVAPLPYYDCGTFTLSSRRPISEAVEQFPNEVGREEIQHFEEGAGIPR